MKGAPTTRTGAWSTRRTGCVSAEDGAAVVETKAGLFLPVADAGSRNAAVPATAMLSSVTAASRTMLQSSSRILMRRKRRGGPAGSTDVHAGSALGKARMEPELNVHFLTVRPEPIPRCSVTMAGQAIRELAIPETTIVVGKQYLKQQAVTLLKFAHTVTDPNVAAGLVEKAADLKSRVDASNASDKSSRAPDVIRSDSPLGRFKR